ncbi:acyltransferase [Lactiplantibacillus carotarum]|uniref:acyltransferase n=1 Tax=Lactiplantibacillus carotarum TaxID=2993456 RepID=UPI00298ED7AB|nr:acyltransferase [Lactiplantibacillus carotarum]
MRVFRGVFKGLLLKKSGILLVGRHVKISNSRHIKTGKLVKFEDYSEIQGLSQNGIVLEDYVTIGRNVQIRPSSYYGVGIIGAGLKVDENSSIGPNGFIGCAGQVNIGKNVMIGPNVTIIAENHNFNEKSTSIKSQGVNQQGITIEDNVWIGANVTILDGVNIGAGSVIGATTLINKDVQANMVYVDKKNSFQKSGN